jgi:hypothetical protein
MHILASGPELRAVTSWVCNLRQKLKKGQILKRFLMAACSSPVGLQLKLLNEKGQHCDSMQLHFLEWLKLYMLYLHEKPS